jgi:hypothetical protein
LTNLLVHVGVTLGVYALVRTLGLARWAATLAAAVFTLHPAIVGTEPGIARRHDTLSALFLMASLVFLLRGRRLLPGVLFLLSILSKETSLAALPFVPLLLRAVDRPMTRAWVLLPPTVIGLGMRLLAIGDLGGYGTATVPSLDALPIYWDRIGKYFTDLLFPAPVRPGTVALIALVMLFVVVAGAALTLPRKERYLAFVGLMWVYGFALFYGGLKVYAGSWYLYIPLVGAGLTVAALASGGVARRAERVGWLPLGLATVLAAGVLVGSPLVMPYPDWSQSHALVDDYLRHVDSCTEDGRPPLYPPNENRRMVFVSPAGLLDYSVTAYITLRFPNGRPCETAPRGSSPVRRGLRFDPRRTRIDCAHADSQCAAQHAVRCGGRAVPGRLADCWRAAPHLSLPAGRHGGRRGADAASRRAGCTALRCTEPRGRAAAVRAAVLRAVCAGC